jgi:UDP-N-acetylmuramoyl-tripeptide--D-alanyl-D-alanine ligase
VAVLGFIAELGIGAPEYHSQVGTYARSTADVVIGVGELAKHYNPDYWFECSEVCSQEIEHLLHSGDCVLVKGSAAARMSVVVDSLKEIGERGLG